MMKARNGVRGETLETNGTEWNRCIQKPAPSLAMKMLLNPFVLPTYISQR